MAPRWRQDGAKMALCWLMLALSGAILVHLVALGSHLVGKLLQDGAKIAQHSAKMAQHSAKIAQHSLQEQPQDPKKPSKVMYCRRIFGFRHF